MSGSNWGEINKSGLIKSIICAVILCGTILIGGLIQHTYYYNDASRNAANYSKNAKNNIAVKCIDMARQASTDCSNKINDAARSNQRDEYDLYSQKAMALWTAIMGGMAIIGVSLSGVGVYLIWQTWGETRKAAESATKTYDTIHSVERARFVTTISDIRTVMNDSPRIEITVNNLGNTAGVTQAFVYAWEVNGEFDSGSVLIGKPRDDVIEGKTKKHILSLVRPKGMDGETYFRGVLTYTSIFGDEHRHYFCFNVWTEWSDMREETFSRSRPAKGKDWPKDT